MISLRVVLLVVLLWHQLHISGVALAPDRLESCTNSGVRFYRPRVMAVVRSTDIRPFISIDDPESDVKLEFFRPVPLMA